MAVSALGVRWQRLKGSLSESRGAVLPLVQRQCGWEDVDGCVMVTWWQWSPDKVRDVEGAQEGGVLAPAPTHVLWRVEQGIAIRY